MIIGPNLAEILNFSTVKHGGAHGGAATLYRLIKLGDLPRFREKPTFSRPQGGRSRGGGWGGDFRHTWGGRWGGVWRTCGAILAKKTRFFEREVCLSIEQRRPPIRPPPHDVSYKIWKYNMWPLTRIKNHVSSIIIYVFMPTNAPLSDFGLFWASQIPGGAPNFGPNTKNRWFFGITFNATVRSPNMWYECNFFNAKQIPHQIYEKSMIHYGGRMRGGAMYVMIYVKVKFLCQNRDNVFVVFSGEPV